MSRKSTRTAAKPKKVEEEVDIEEDEEEEVVEKTKGKRAAPKTASKGKGKKKVEEEDEDDDEDGGDDAETSKKAKTSVDTSNPIVTLADFLKTTEGSKSLKEMLTITPATVTTTQTTTNVNNDGSSSTNVTTLKELASEGFEAHFDEIAHALLNRSILFVGGHPHRILELEFYCNGHQHIDLFAHGHERQKKRAEWYFHMTGKGYKGGSYKGLDVTFGDDEFFGGILLRTIQPLFGDKTPIEGPSLLVDHVLRMTNASTIEQLVSRFDLTAELKDRSKTDHPLFFVHSDTDISLPGFPVGTVYKGARVGLSMKTFEDGKQTYVGKFYRYMVNPDKIKKGRNYFVVSLHQQGLTPKQIVEITKGTGASVEKMIAQFKQGAAKDYKIYCHKNLKNDEISAMLGACSLFSYPTKK